jgi:DNA-directed RNA polymerase specialized sigma24 family protein
MTQSTSGRGITGQASDSILEPGVEIDLGRIEDPRRFDADIKLVTRLRLDNFEGPGWDRLADHLARYAAPIFRAWITSGEIFTLCWRRNFRTGKPLPLSNDEVDELVFETIGTAIASFRDNVLRKNGWSPSQGASLATFFVGHCFSRFPNAYRRLLRERPPPTVSLEQTEHDPRDYSKEGDPEAAVMSEQEANRILSQAPNRRTQLILKLRSEGYSQIEIAEVLGVTAKAIESALYRHRRRLSEGGET